MKLSHRIWSLLPVLLLLLCGCAQTAKQQTPQLPADAEIEAAWDTLTFDRETELLFAEQFSVSASDKGYQKISIGDGNVYLVVPEGGNIPAGVPEDVTVLCQPLDNIYLAATSAMDLFRQLDAVDAVTLSGVNASGWYIQEARDAMEAGRMTYAGKYSAPDYEQILSAGCSVAVESTMIYHNPEVKEQLERLGVPVLVERSSYESHPLGRMEWIKLYAALLGKEAEAESYFSGVVTQLTPIMEQENTGKTVAFFYITANGAVNVRRAGDYIAQSICLAGGQYIFPDLEPESGAQATMNMQMESFYEGARDADVLIYSGTIDGDLENLDQLLEKSAVLADFRAVQEKSVWCTGKNLFQESLGLGNLIADLHTILTGEPGELTYLHHLD